MCFLEDLLFRRPYDCIFTSWGLCYLSDEQVVRFLKRAIVSLERHDGKHGLVVCKETVRTLDDDYTYHVDQRMLIRTVDEYSKLFKLAGYKVVYIAKTSYKWYAD